MAIALSKEKVQAQHGILSILTFVVLFVVNNIVLHLANMIAPDHVVLGTASISHYWAMYHSMFKLTVACTFLVPLITYYEWYNKTTFSPKQWMLAYLVFNFAVLWVISRFSENLGLGFSSWFVILVFAGVLDMVQGWSMMLLGEKTKKLFA